VQCERDAVVDEVEIARCAAWIAAGKWSADDDGEPGSDGAAAAAGPSTAATD
jgi:hypothetical protein